MISTPSKTSCLLERTSEQEIELARELSTLILIQSEHVVRRHVALEVLPRAESLDRWAIVADEVRLPSFGLPRWLPAVLHQRRLAVQLVLRPVLLLTFCAAVLHAVRCQSVNPHDVAAPVNLPAPCDSSCRQTCPRPGMLRKRESPYWCNKRQRFRHQRS